MEIRKITNNDLEILTELLIDAYDNEWKKERALKYLKKFFTFEPSSCLLAEEDGKILGAVFAFSHDHKDDFILFIQELFVGKEQRHKGVAKTLLSELRHSFEENPKVKVTPMVQAPTNVLNFYNSLGFEKEAVFSFYDD